MALYRPPNDKLTKPLKRFIAGAACPRCQQVDKLYTLQVGNSVSRHCAKCDFSESLDELVTQSSSKDTSPTQTKEKAKEWQALNFKE